MTQDEMRKEAKELWDRVFERATLPSQYNPDFTELIQQAEIASELAVSEHLQPWLQILNDSIQWLFNIWGILDRNVLRKEPVNLMPPTNIERSVWALLGSCCTHAVAVRRLVLSGLDTPARAELRVLDEHLCACIAMLHDRNLAELFKLNQSPDTANNLWYEKLNTKAIRKYLNAVERNIGLEPHESHDLRLWREEENRILSQAIHPSYVTSVLSSRNPSLKNQNISAIATLGHGSVMSERTLNYACKSIWYFSRLAPLLLFEDYLGRPPVITILPGDEMCQAAIAGREVLTELNLKYWDYEIYNRDEWPDN